MLESDPDATAHRTAATGPRWFPARTAMPKPGRAPRSSVRAQRGRNLRPRKYRRPPCLRGGTRRGAPLLSEMVLGTSGSPASHPAVLMFPSRRWTRVVSAAQRLAIRLCRVEFLHRKDVNSVLLHPLANTFVIDAHRVGPPSCVIGNFLYYDLHRRISDIKCLAIVGE